MLRRFFINYYVRCISTSNFSCGVDRMMKKLISKPQKQRKFINEAPILSTTKSLAAITGDGKKSTNIKRVNVLNKLFMRHITDLMSTGGFSHAFIGHGIEINRVKVSSDFSCVKVYWLARTEKLVENIENILKAHACALRHELTQLHVLGVVPKIEFVKDNHYTLLKLLDDKLAQADYGEEHEPLDSASRLKCELELQTKLESSVKQKIATLESASITMDAILTQDDPKEHFKAPVMPQNVLGLDRAAIYQRVVKNIHKSKGLSRNANEYSTKLNELTSDINHDPVSYSSMRQQQEAFKEFLNKRIALKHKKLRDDCDNLCEFDHMEEEWEAKRENDLKKYDFYEYLADEGDYIEDVDACDELKEK